MYANLSYSYLECMTLSLDYCLKFIIRILGSVKIPLREVVHNGRQPVSQTLTGKHGEKLTVSYIIL
jgi:hypothetical protein